MEACCRATRRLVGWHAGVEEAIARASGCARRAAAHEAAEDGKVSLHRFLNGLTDTQYCPWYKPDIHRMMYAASAGSATPQT